MVKVLCSSVLGLAFLVACGGSSSHDSPRDRHDSRPPNVTGGAGDDSKDAAGEGGTVATGGAIASGGRDTGTGGTSPSGGSNPQPLGGMDGVGEAGAAPTLQLPAGCEPRGRMETADLCSLAVYCDTASQLTNCARLDSGRWQCACELQHRERIYQFENAPGLQACALAASLCAEDDLDLGKEACEATDESNFDDSCYLQLACGRPIDLAAETNARAWLMRFGSASCEVGLTGNSYNCGCTYGDTSRDYDLLVASGAPDCRPLVDFCMSGETPNFDGEQQCLLTNTVSNSDGCERDEACGASVPLTDDASIAQLEPRYANCVPRAGGGAECYCSDRDSSFGFRLADPPDDASCESSSLNCGADVVIETTGAASCEPTSLNAYADSCEADLSCLQDATVDGRPIVAEGRLIVDCARVELGMPWWCSCASDQETARFQLGAADLSAWQACGEAPAGCLEHLAVHVGPYGEFVQPPDPLP